MSNLLDKDGAQRKDLVTSIGLWVVAEFVGFVLFPALQLIKPEGATMRNWFLTSLPLGLGGILLMVASAKVVIANTESDHQLKTFANIALAVIGWIAVAGILYPLWVVCIEFFGKSWTP